MRRIALTVITIYQLFFSLIFKQLLGVEASCRYRPTCSDYTKGAIRTHGVVKGAFMGIRRIASCSPLTRYGTV